MSNSYAERSHAERSHADRLQIEDNKADYESRKAENRRIIGELEQLLDDKSITDRDKAVEKLKIIGLSLGEGFEKKDLWAMREEAERILAQMREMFLGTLRVSAKRDLVSGISANVSEDTVAGEEAAGTAVERDIAAGEEATGTAVERDAKGIEAQLSALSERFISVDAMNVALKRVNVEIPEDEVARLKGLLPAELTSEVRKRVIKLQKKTERKEAPLVMQLPLKIIVNGQEKPFTIATMQAVMREAHEADSSRKRLSISNDVKDEIKNKTWGSKLRVWTSACLQGSKNKSHQGEYGQLEYQKEVLSEGHEIHADMVLAMALRYIQTGEDIMLHDRYGYMHLNETDDELLELAVDATGIGICVSSGYAHSHIGIGGSFGIDS